VVSARFVGLIGAAFVVLTILGVRAWDIEQAIKDQRNAPRIERLRAVLAEAAGR
jgi:hypothetical protein